MVEKGTCGVCKDEVAGNGAANMTMVLITVDYERLGCHIQEFKLYPSH